MTTRKIAVDGYLYTISKDPICKSRKHYHQIRVEKIVPLNETRYIGTANIEEINEDS